MTPAEKLRRVESLNREALELEQARIWEQYGDISGDEMRMRIGVWRLGLETMVKVFGWDPDEKGW